MELISACFFLASLLLPVMNAFDTDFCNTTLCRRYKDGAWHQETNIGCNADNFYSSNCPDNAQLQNMTDDMQALVVGLHNEHRNMIASGNFSYFDPAVRMTTMRWSDELAYLAQINAYRCYYGPDKCRNTDEFPHAGQNIDVTWSSGGYKNHTDIVTHIFNAWWNEHGDASMKIINKYYPSGRLIGHFTQIITAKSSALGCALMYWKDPEGYYNQYMVCDYAFTNYQGEAVYVSGQTASQCQTGSNPQYPNLCSVNEIVPPLPIIS